MIMTKTIKRLGIEVTIRTRKTVEISMSEDWADCIVGQAEELFELTKHIHEDESHPRQELRDLITIINEALR